MLMKALQETSAPFVVRVTDWDEHEELFDEIIAAATTTADTTTAATTTAATTTAIPTTASVAVQVNLPGPPAPSVPLITSTPKKGRLSKILSKTKAAIKKLLHSKTRFTFKIESYQRQ